MVDVGGAVYVRFFCFGTVESRYSLCYLGAVGTVATPVAGYFLYRQKITKIGLFALALIIVSIVVLNLYG